MPTHGLSQLINSCPTMAGEATGGRGSIPGSHIMFVQTKLKGMERESLGYTFIALVVGS